MLKYKTWMVRLSLGLLASGFPAAAKPQQAQVVPGVKSGLLEAQGTGASAGQQLPEQRLSGSISGIIVDPTGGAVVGARVRLSRDDQSPDQEVLSGDDGQFSFANVAPGPFGITITSTGFATQASAGILRPGRTTLSRKSLWLLPLLSLRCASSFHGPKLRKIRSRRKRSNGF